MKQQLDSECRDQHREPVRAYSSRLAIVNKRYPTSLQRASNSSGFSVIYRIHRWTIDETLKACHPLVSKPGDLHALVIDNLID